MTVAKNNNLEQNGKDESLDGSSEKKPEKKGFSNAQKISLAMFAAMEFMNSCSMSVMAPFYTKEASLKGMSESMSGFVFSFYALVMFVSAPVFGILMPKAGIRFTYIAGILFSGILNILFGTLHYIEDNTLFTILCFVIRGIEALGTSAYSTATFVLVREIFPDIGSTVRGLLETFVGLGLSVGPALGGLLYSIGGFGLPFYVIGVTVTLLAPLNALVIPQLENRPLGKEDGSFLKLLRLPHILVVSGVIVVVALTWSFLDPTLEPHLRKYDLSPGSIGLIFLLLSTMYGVFSPAWGWLADKIPTYWWLMPMGLFTSAISLFFLGPSSAFSAFISDSLWINLASLAVLGVFVAMALMPTYQGLIDGATDGGFNDSIYTQSFISGVWSCSYSFGEVIGPVVGGFLLEHFSFPTTTTVIGVINIVMAVLSTLYFCTKSSLSVKCEKDTTSICEGGKFKSNIGEFAIFTVEGKVASNGTIIKANGMVK